MLGSLWHNIDRKFVLESAVKRRGRSDRKVEVKEKILASAIELFSKFGYANVKMSQIAENADLTTGAVYYYFESKAEILDIIAVHYIGRVATIAEDVYLRSDLSPKEKLSLLINEHCEGVAKYKPHLAIFYQDHKHLSTQTFENAIEMNSRFLTYTTRIIQEGMDAGIFRKDIDAKVAALGIIGMGNWVYQWFSPKGLYRADEIGGFFEKLMLEGLVQNSAEANANATQGARKAKR